MRVLVSVTAGPAKGKSFAFDQPDFFLFGRAEDARVSLPNDPFVSRQHFLLEIAPPSCKVTDLDSKNGTFVNGIRYGGRKAADPGVRVAPPGENSVTVDGDSEIVVGDTRMSITIDTSEKNMLEPPPENDKTVLEPPPDAKPLPTVRRGSSIRSVFEEKDSSLQKTRHSEPKPGVPTLEHGGKVTSNPTAVRSGMPAPPRPMMRLVNCAVCGEDATAEAGVRGQIADAEFVCKKCRDESKDERTVIEAPAVARSKSIVSFPGYKLQSILGRGGMGIVYKAIQESTGRIVAIKSLLPQVAISFQSYRTFHREIEVTRQLRHPNIVELIDHGNIKGMYYCVLEFVDGMDLKQLVTQMGGSMTLQDAAPILLGVLDGLAFAHRAQITTRAAGPSQTFQGIVHRDIKPENILLQRSGTGWIPKVADFGIAKSFESAGMTDMTMAGVCGTPIYWPREQITHYRYLHPATDVFSVASVFYEILTGVWARPGLRETMADCLSRNQRAQLADFMRVIGGNPIRPIRDFNKTVPPPVAAVLDRALLEIEVPNDENQMRDSLKRLRYADAGILRDELKAAIRLSGIEV